MNILAAEGYGWTIFWIALLVILLILMIVMFNFIGLYIRAMVSGAHVTWLSDSPAVDAAAAEGRGRVSAAA